MVHKVILLHIGNVVETKNTEEELSNGKWHTAYTPFCGLF